jgi:hypothetical protein
MHVVFPGSGAGVPAGKWPAEEGTEKVKNRQRGRLKGKGNVRRAGSSCERDEQVVNDRRAKPTTEAGSDTKLGNNTSRQQQTREQDNQLEHQHTKTKSAE